MRVKGNIVTGSRLQKSREAGYDVMVFKVWDLPQVDNIREVAALAVDSISGEAIPRYGEPHRSINGLVADQILVIPVANSRTQARIYVTFANRPPVRIWIDGIEIRTTTVFDKDNKLNRIYYKPSNGDYKYSATDTFSSAGSITSPIGNSPDEWLTDLIELPYERSGMMLMFEREEKTNPYEKVRLCTDTVSMKDWLGGEPYTWKTKKITARSINTPGEPIRWLVTYVFEYKRNTWNTLAVFKDRRTGEVPREIDTSKATLSKPNEGNGWKVIVNHDTFVFANYFLPDPRENTAT